MVIHTNIILLILSRESSADGDTEVVIRTNTILLVLTHEPVGRRRYPSGCLYKHSSVNPDP